MRNINDTYKNKLNSMFLNRGESDGLVSRGGNKELWLVEEF